MSILDRFKESFSHRQKPEKELCANRPDKLTDLTAREYEALSILIEGYTLRFCAEKMGIRYSTANTYQNAIYKKLGVNSRAKLIIEYKDVVQRSDTNG